MKRLLKMLAIMLLLKPAYGQITGQVFNEQDELMPYVNVLVLNSRDSSLVKGSLTNEDGEFLVDAVPSGEYMLQLNFIGFEKWFSEVFQVGGIAEERDFKKLVLKEEATMLEGVQISAQKMLIEQTVEGTTINLENTMMSKGTTALQIVERSPGVILDPRTNTLSLNGQSGTLIMLNGRPVRMDPSEVITLLRGMSSDNLEKVEILTNPSAKYDADGTAGIINLVVKKGEDEGTNGSVSVTGGYGWGPKQAANMNLNHRSGSTNYYGSYSFNRDNFFTDWHGMGSSSLEVLGGDFNWDFGNNTEVDNYSHNVTAGVERQFDRGLLLGTNLLYNKTLTSTSIFNDGKYYFPNDDFLNALIYVNGDGSWDNFNTTVFAEKSLSEDQKISLDLDYLYYQSNAPTGVSSEYEDGNGESTVPDNEIYANGNRGESNTRIDVGVVKLDYELNVRNRLTIETGVKGTYSKTENEAFIERFDGSDWILDERNIAQLEVMEKIGAGYVSTNFSIDSLTSLSAGLRYEYWDQDFDDNSLDRSFGRFFPSLFFSRTLAPRLSLQSAYNRRITRPDYNDLTNFLRYNGPTSVFTGNPYLRPALSDNFKASLVTMDMSFSLLYTYESNPIARYQLSENEEANLAYISPQNVDYIRSYGFQTHLPFSIAKWWTANLGGTFSYREFSVEYTNQPVAHSYFTFNCYANQTFTLPKDFSIELNGWYTSEQFRGSTRMEGFGMINLGLKKELANNQGSLQFTVTDLLQSMNIWQHIGSITTEAYNSEGRVKYQPESTNNRIFRLTYYRSFGSNKIKSRANRKSSSVEEKSRISQD